MCAGKDEWDAGNLEKTGRRSAPLKSSSSCGQFLHKSTSLSALESKGHPHSWDSNTQERTPSWPADADYPMKAWTVAWLLAKDQKISASRWNPTTTKIHSSQGPSTPHQQYKLDCPSMNDGTFSSPADSSMADFLIHYSAHKVGLVPDT